MYPPRKSLYYAGFNEVLTRVAYQLVVRDYRRRPADYVKSPFNAMLELAQALRVLGFGTVAWPIIAAAKWVCQGYSLAEWREHYPWFAHPNRAAFKVRPPVR